MAKLKNKTAATITTRAKFDYENTVQNWSDKSCKNKYSQTHSHCNFEFYKTINFIGNEEEKTEKTGG